MSPLRRTVLLALLSLSAARLAAQPPTRPAITGVAFARFYTTNPKAAQNFYGDTLGFAQKDDAGVWLYPVNHAQWIEVLNATPQSNARLAAVGFTTSDAAQLAELSPGPRHHARAPAGRRPVLLCAIPKATSSSSSRAARRNSSPPRPRLPNATSKRIIHVGFRSKTAKSRTTSGRASSASAPTGTAATTKPIPTGSACRSPTAPTGWSTCSTLRDEPTLKQFGSMDHVSLGVTHMPDVVAALARNHCDGPNCSASKVGRDGKTQLNLFDPDQTRIEFMEFAPVQDPCCSPFTGKHPTADDTE